MKKIFLVLAAGITIISCNEADKQTGATDATSSNTATTAADTGNKAAASNPVAQQTTPVIDSANLTSIQWLDGQDKDFGKIKEGENLDVSFRFKNTGSKPLVISRVWAQCGCTIPETPQKPYAPGETGVIKASFNSSGKPGTNTKEVYLTANSNPETTTLKFHVDVKPKS